MAFELGLLDQTTAPYHYSTTSQNHMLASSVLLFIYYYLRFNLEKKYMRLMGIEPWC